MLLCGLTEEERQALLHSAFVLCKKKNKQWTFDTAKLELLTTVYRLSNKNIGCISRRKLNKEVVPWAKLLEKGKLI